MGLGAPGTPGAYRDRYLYRVTINTNSWKVALGIILGPCGKVTYTYLYSPLSAPFRSYPPPSLSSSISFSLFSLSRLDRKRIIISDRSMIVCASLLLMLYVLTPPPPFSPLFPSFRRKSNLLRLLLSPSSSSVSFVSFLFLHLNLFLFYSLFVPFACHLVVSFSPRFLAFPFSARRLFFATRHCPVRYPGKPNRGPSVSLMENRTEPSPRFTPPHR